MLDIGRWPERVRKPGRPRAIPAKLEPVIVALYRRGYGYRAITSILQADFGINPHFTSVRITLLRLGELEKKVRHEDLS